MKRSLTLVVVVLLMTSMLFSACGTDANNAPEPEATALLLEVPAVVSATGEVMPERYATLSLAAGGRVAEVLVSEGQAVQAGDVLLRLDGGESLQAAVGAAELELLSAQQALDALYDNVELDRAAAELRLALANKALDKADKKVKGLTYRIGDRETVDTARANLILAEDAVKRAEDSYNYFTDDPDESVGKANALSILAATRQERDKARINLNYLLSVPTKLESDETNANFAVAQAEVNAAQRELNDLQAGPDPDALVLAEARVASAETQLAASQATVDDLVLTAPFDAIVGKLHVQPSEWLSPGAPALDVADLDNLLVETTDLSEIDVARLRLGDNAAITFDALPGVAVGGTVIYVAVKSEEGSGVNYTVKLSLEETPPQLLWGMTAFVDIVVADQQQLPDPQQ
ncbi:MAG: HlyD family efflux transporter periplasmic adaptor subunit [Anaerolineae bacterium]|nr:HlyD family efflux transporter periplasmic adaptor subunit [Anaerolineae bacterium]